LCWAPFNDAAERVVPESRRATALSVVSTGTSFGVVAAALLALAVTEGALDWRGAWVGFAGGGLVLAAIAWAGVPARRGAGATPEGAEVAQVRTGLRLTQRAAIPLYGTALCFGMTNAIFLSFAADRVVAAGGLFGMPDEAAAVVIFLGYGICGLVGFAAGRIEARIGLAPLFAAIFAAGALSLVLIALAPTSWSAVVLASGLHGAAIMMVSAVLSFWSLRLFPGRGTAGFTAALVSMAAGSVAGPGAGGAARGGPGAPGHVPGRRGPAAGHRTLVRSEAPVAPPASAPRPRVTVGRGEGHPPRIFPNFSVAYDSTNALSGIQMPMAIIIRLSVSETKPSGTDELPPTQAHLSSRLSM
jgi:predicted MFS family arabinose efflux permease